LPEYLTQLLVAMAALSRAGQYDWLADGVERVTGRPAMSVRELVSLHAAVVGLKRSTTPKARSFNEGQKS
jgi:hypothetical protein